MMPTIPRKALWTSWVAIAALTCVIGCRQSGGRISEISINPAAVLAPGATATLSIEVDGMRSTDVLLWTATEGVFRTRTDVTVVKWSAPPEECTAVISCTVIKGGESSVRHVKIEVVAEPVPEAATTARSSDSSAIPAVRPAADPPSEQPVGDVEDAGFIPSAWMGDAEAGPPVVSVDNECSEQPRSMPFCQKWTYQPLPSGQGWAAVGWQYPENNFGNVAGLNLSGQGITKVSFWVRGLPDANGNLPKVQFKAGGHTNSGSRYPASFSAQTSFLPLTEEWQLVTIPLDGKSLENVACVFAWTCRRTDNPNGATFFLDDIRYE